MISIQKRFLFIHVPKTGGNSIQNILRDYSEDDIVLLAKHQDGIERFEVRNSQYDITKHSTLSHYKSVLDDGTYRSLYKFAVIRNPWDRMISFYFSPHRGVKEWSRKSFLSLVDKVPPIRQYVVENQRLSESISRNLGDDVDFMMKFENLEEDFRIVCNKIDIQPTSLPKRNASDRLHYSQYYDEELIEFVNDRFKDEIEYGNYRFEDI